MIPPAPAAARFLESLRACALGAGDFRVTLGKPQGSDPTLRKLLIRPVRLKAGQRLAFVWRHDTRDVTQNLELDEALATVGRLIGTDFLDAHLRAQDRTLQLECSPSGARLRTKEHEAGNADATPRPGSNDRPKFRPIPPDAPWLRALGITDEAGRPRAGMAGKFRQIERFAELLTQFTSEAELPSDRPFEVVDMGCGKGYLTFAASAVLGPRAHVRGVELRPHLVELGNRIAAESGLAPGLAFTCGSIADVPADRVDILIALHACDTATDDALARGITAKAALLLVAPCCQKEVRPSLVPPGVLAPALKHGIFLERQAEFVTDALRALLLEWAGYRTRVIEFISTEHTAKNTLIAGVRTAASGNEAVAARIRAFAAFYGIRSQTLATHLGFALA